MAIIRMMEKCGRWHRDQLAKQIRDLRRIHGPGYRIFPKSNGMILSKDGNVRVPLNPIMSDRLANFLHEVRKSKAVLGRVESGNYCYEARLGMFNMLPGSSVTLDFVVTKREIPCQSTPIMDRHLDHERAAMERAANHLQMLVARNTGIIEWMKLPETKGEPLAEVLKRSCWTPVMAPKRSCWAPIIAPRDYSQIISVFIPVYATV